VELTPHPIEGETRLLLGLEAAVHVQLGLGARAEELRDCRNDEEEDRQDDNQLDKRVPVPASQAPGEPAEVHFVFAST
jgi:hypothetical protein